MVLSANRRHVKQSDLLYVKAGSPLAIGHEGVGEVVAVGSDVTSLKLGDMAGAGFQRSSCGEVSSPEFGH